MAQVLKLVDKQDLESCALGRVGSTPTLGTKSQLCGTQHYVVHQSVLATFGSGTFRGRRLEWPVAP